ncbi:hypothetical protein A2U01_0032921, partial [Trifolium medium]|nr:hypothetical protein [Trifolium medium]
SADRGLGGPYPWPCETNLYCVGWGTIPMYQIAFQQLGYRMHFTDPETAVFRHLRVSPSQLHPNSLAFLRAFEVTAGYLEIVPTLKLFFHAFGLQHSSPKGEKAKGKVPKGVEKESSKHDWVSFKQRKCFFKMFEECVCGFKEKYYGVRPITSKGWKSIV